MDAVVVGVFLAEGECGCPYCKEPLPTSKAIEDLGDKLAAKLLLVGRGAHLLVPSASEWIGLNKMDLDGEL